MGNNKKTNTISTSNSKTYTNITMDEYLFF